MRIALVHSFYSRVIPSGENVVVEQQIGALRDAGHDLLAVTRETDVEMQRSGHLVRAAARVALGRDNEPAERINAFEPDVIHVHNLFPNFGHSWIDRVKAPVVATLHNYRPTCPGGALARDGIPCTACLTHTKANALRHGCYRGSRLATLPQVVRNPRNVTFDPLLRRCARFICLSDAMKRDYTRLGLDPSRIDIIENAISPSPSQPRPVGNGWVFVGRLTPEKGISNLLGSWPSEESLDVIGDGPLEVGQHKQATPNVNFLGNLENDQVRKRLVQYEGLILPSVWRETSLPLVVLEALAAGLPIIAGSHTAASRFAESPQCGAVLPGMSPSHIRKALEQVRNSPSLRNNCREFYESNYSPQKWLERTQCTYEKVALATR